LDVVGSSIHAVHALDRTETPSDRVEIFMLKKILISMAPVALLALASASAPAQPVRPSLEVRIANTAPPRARYERIPQRPDRDSVWIKGYSHWEGTRWGWVSGRWERPAARSHRWIAPRYRREANVWRYEPPHWSHERVVEGDEYRHWREEHRRN
jgi:hypothetical protein